MISERDILASCACHRVRTAARAVTRAYNEALRPVGLRATQLAVLVATAGTMLCLLPPSPSCWAWTGAL